MKNNQKMAGNGRDQPPTPTNPSSSQPAQPQTPKAQSQAIVAPATQQQVTVEQPKSQISFNVPQKPEAAPRAPEDPVEQQPSKQPDLAATSRPVKPESATQISVNQSSKPSAVNQTMAGAPPSSTTAPEEGKEQQRRTTGNKFELTEQNLEAHQKLIQFDQAAGQGARTNQATAQSQMPSNPMVSQPSKASQPSGTQSQQGAPPQITIPVSGNNATGRAVGTTSTGRQKKTSQQAQANQQNAQAAGANQVQSQIPDQQLRPDKKAQQAIYQNAAAAQAQMLAQQKGQQQRMPQMTNEQQIAFYRQQQLMQQQQFEQQQSQMQQIPQSSQQAVNGQPPNNQIVHPGQPSGIQQSQAQSQQMMSTDQQQHALRSLHHQQQQQHSSQSAQVAYQTQQQQHEQNNHQKIMANITQTIRQRIYGCYQEKIQSLKEVDLSHAETLAKVIKKEELIFFLKTDEPRYSKTSLLDQKNQRMDEYIAYCAENGGRVIPKQPEPIAPPHESPQIVEMRMMHMEFVEEAYWKRLQASRIARECRVVAIQKAKQRAQRLVEEKQRQQQLVDQKKREEEQKAKDLAQAEAQSKGVVDGQNGASVVNPVVSGDLAMKEQQESNNLLPSDEHAFGDLQADDDFGNELAGDGGGFLGDDFELMSMGMDQEPLDLMAEQPIPFDQANDNDYDMQDDNFDPEQELMRQEVLLEQQRIEENKKQEEQKLQKIEEIEQKQSHVEVTHDHEVVSPTKRVQANLAEDSEMDDRLDKLTELENKILALDMSYLKPDNLEKELRQQKPEIAEENKGDDVAQDTHQSASKAKNNDMQSVFPSFKKETILGAQSAVNKKFEKLGQLLAEQGANATEIMQSEQFNQAFGGHSHAIQIEDKMGRDYAALNDQLKSMMLDDDQVGLYVMPGMDDYQFDPDELAFSDEDMEDSEDSVVEMDDFFSEIPGQVKVKKESIKATTKGLKMRPPRVVGDEQKKLYKEMDEINQIAPERNDLAYMEHLCLFWMKHENEDIEDNEYRKEWFESALNGCSQKDRKGLLQMIEKCQQSIDNSKRNLLKYGKAEQYQPKRLHKEKFLLSGTDNQVQNQNALAPQEFSFIKWYYALFPDQWRLIADIINYHPLTRGALHCKEFMARAYFDRLDWIHRDLLLNRQKIQMQPWRETKLPWLINGREGCLMNSMTYLNKSHLQSIHMVSHLTHRQRRVKQNYGFSTNEQGCLQVEPIRPVIQEQKPVVTEGEKVVELPAELAGQKRTRAEADTENNSMDDSSFLGDADGRHYSDVQIHDKLLNQMLSRRRKFEAEEQDAAAKGTLTHCDIYADRPLLKELMVDIAYKRKKTNEQSSEIVPKFKAFAYDPVKADKDELDKHTPMWYALQNKNSCQITIRVQHSTMFWLGYFIRRIMHEENLEKLQKHIRVQQNQVWESKNEVKHFFINQAKQVRLQQTESSSGENNLQFQQEKQNKEQLQKAIQHFVEKMERQTETRVEIKEVNELWNGISPYHYAKEQKHEYIKQEKDCDQRISYVMYNKSKQLWDELQFYWFQVNKNLHPRYRKDLVMVNSDMQQMAAAQQRLLAQQYEQDPSGQQPGAAQVNAAHQMQQRLSAQQASAAQQLTLVAAQQLQQQQRSGQVPMHSQGNSILLAQQQQQQRQQQAAQQAAAQQSQPKQPIMQTGANLADPMMIKQMSEQMNNAQQNNLAIANPRQNSQYQINMTMHQNQQIAPPNANALQPSSQQQQSQQAQQQQQFPNNRTNSNQPGPSGQQQQQQPGPQPPGPQ